MSWTDLIWFTWPLSELNDIADDISLSIGAKLVSWHDLLDTELILLVDHVWWLCTESYCQFALRWVSFQCTALGGLGLRAHLIVWHHLAHVLSHGVLCHEARLKWWQHLVRVFSIPASLGLAMTIHDFDLIDVLASLLMAALLLLVPLEVLDLLKVGDQKSLCWNCTCICLLVLSFLC